MHLSQRLTGPAYNWTSPAANHAKAMGRLHHPAASGSRRL